MTRQPITSIRFWCPHCRELHGAITYWQVAGVAVCRLTNQIMSLGTRPTRFDELAPLRRAQAIVQMRQTSCAHYWVRIVGPGRTERCTRCDLVWYRRDVYRRARAYHVQPTQGFDGVWVDEDGEAWLGVVRDDRVELAEDDEGEWIAAPVNWRDLVIVELGK